MNAKILVILGNVEIIDFGKKVNANKGSILSENAKITTLSNGKVELEIDGKVFMIPNDQTYFVKDISKMTKVENSNPTNNAGLRG